MDLSVKTMITYKKNLSHHTYYFSQFSMLVLGFFLILLFSYDISIQFMILIFILLSYITLGFVHHRIDHTFSAKIVIEYVLISSLVLAGFVFFNLGRL